MFASGVFSGAAFSAVSLEDWEVPIFFPCHRISVYPIPVLRNFQSLLEGSSCPREILPEYNNPVSVQDLYSKRQISVTVGRSLSAGCKRTIS